MEESTTQIRHARRLDLLLCLLLAAVTFFVTLVFSLFGCDPHHDGVMFEAALKVSRGAVLFRDTFTQYGSLAIYYDALFIRLFGESMRSIQIAACTALAGCSCLVYSIAKKLTNRPLAFFAAALVAGLNYVYFWHSHPWSSVPAMLFQLLACEMFLRTLPGESAAGALRHKEEPRRQGGGLFALAVSGACGALGAFCRLPVGLLTFLAGFGALVLLQLAGREKAAKFFKKLAAYCLGFAAAMALLFLPVILTGTFEAWWGMQVVGTSGFAAATNTAGASTGFAVRLVWDLFGAWILRNPLLDWIWLLLPACMGLTLLAAGWPVLTAYFKNFRAPQIPKIQPVSVRLVVVCTFAFGGWAQYYPVACYRHWFWSAVPMLPILAFDLWWLCRNRAHRTRAACLLLAVLLAGNVAVRGRFALASLGVWPYEKDQSETRPGITSFYLDENWNRTGAQRYQNATQPYLDGLWLNAETADFYNELFAKVDELKAKDPEINFINRTAEGFLGVFQTEYMPYCDAPYAEYTQIENEYIAREKPVVITQSETDWQGYSPEYHVYAKITGSDGRLNNTTVYLMAAD